MTDRREVSFRSGADDCAAWWYSPRSTTRRGSACAVMAHGLTLTRHDGLAAYAERFARGGAAVLVFDHRHLGDSGGAPRQRVRRAEQLADWRRAVAFARELPGVDPRRIVLWGYSFSGGHAVDVAATDARVGGVLVLAPFLNGWDRIRRTPAHQTAWLLRHAAADVLGRGRTVPVTGPPGSHGVMTFPGEAEGFARVAPARSPWRNAISAGALLQMPAPRPLAKAARIVCPLWAGLCRSDVSVSSSAIRRLAARAPGGELHSYPYDHFEPFADLAARRVAADQVDFLRRRSLL